MLEILSAEQPCILCGQALLIVTVYSEGAEEKVRREDVPHDDAACLSFLRLQDETWPAQRDRTY